jgi:Spy/CpxP family protein refolding chaperone
MTLRSFQRVTAVVLIGAAVGVAALVGARAWAQVPPGGAAGGPHGRMMKRMISAALDEALDQAGVSAEQRSAIHASRDRAFAALETARPDRTAQRDEVLALFEGDRLDPSQLQAVHAQMEQQHQAMRTAVTQAIIEIHDTLTPAQRHAVAGYVRTMAPHGMR